MGQGGTDSFPEIYLVNFATNYVVVLFCSDTLLTYSHLGMIKGGVFLLRKVVQDRPSYRTLRQMGVTKEEGDPGSWKEILGPWFGSQYGRPFPSRTTSNEPSFEISTLTFPGGGVPPLYRFRFQMD